MLGIPQGGEEDIGVPFQYNSFLNAFFVQDDWKVKRNFTVSIGIRLEHELPVNESQNRITNGFSTTATTSIRYSPTNHHSNARRLNNSRLICEISNSSSSAPAASSSA